MGNIKDNDFYDNAWESSWQDMKKYSPVGKHTRRWILKLLGKIGDFDSICDFGCGVGSLLSEIKEIYPDKKLCGMDFSASSIELCRKRFSDVEFAVHDVLEEKEPFGKVFDIGITSEVIEHIQNDAFAVKNMAGWCKYLILTVPGGHLDEMADEMGHLRHYSAASIRKLVEDSGLELVYVKEWGFPFAYPWYASMRNKAGYGAVTGKYSPMKKAVSFLLYYLFFLNDFFNSGNKVFAIIQNKNLENR